MPTWADKLITIVTPLCRPGSAKTAASVCLYSVYKKQERPLFTAALEQTSNVPTAIVRQRACGLLYPASGRQSRLSFALHFCFLTDAPRRRRRGRPLPAVSRTHPPRDVDWLSSGVRREGGRRWFPGPSSAGRWPLHFPGRAPPVPPPDGFERATAGYVDRPQTGWGPVIGRERRRVRPMIAPPPFAPSPAIQLRSPTRTRAKSITSFSLSKPVPGFKTGYRFTGSRLTSLVASNFCFLASDEYSTQHTVA